jgi:hypothetical protein
MNIHLNEIYIKFPTGKYLSYAFPIQNNLKRRDAFSPLIFPFSLEFIVGKVKKKDSLIHNVINQLVFVNVINLLDETINIRSINIDKLSEA